MFSAAGKPSYCRASTATDCRFSAALFWCRHQPHAARSGVYGFPLRLSHRPAASRALGKHADAPTCAGSFQRALSFWVRRTAALTSFGSYPTSGRDGWESNPPRRFWRPPRQPWYIRPCIGGFRLYTLRRAQPLSMCRHTGADHSCHRFRLHDRRAAFSLHRRVTSAPSLRYSVFPQSAPWPLERRVGL